MEAPSLWPDVVQTLVLLGAKRGPGHCSVEEQDAGPHENHVNIYLAQVLSAPQTLALHQDAMPVSACCAISARDLPARRALLREAPALGVAHARRRL